MFAADKAEHCLWALQKWASGYAAPDYVTMLQLSFGWATSVGYPHLGTANTTFPVVVTEMEALMSSHEVRALWE